jgi:non-specific serine/threonine protein kinase
MRTRIPWAIGNGDEAGGGRSDMAESTASSQEMDNPAALLAGQRRDNLPADATRFIGRQGEVPAIVAAVRLHRLVTLHGTGGVGKTRLARRAAGELRDHFADGCWLVELSALRAPELLPAAVSAALGLSCETAGDPLGALAAALAERKLLLILDTCEHLIGACAGLAQALLAAAPGLHVLATSRELLGNHDEQAVLISPLRLPPAPDADGAAATDVAAAARCDAVALFVDRARAAVPGFALTERNAATVIELCRRLDGIPLALELAAVRLRAMPLAEILTRLAPRFSVLGTSRTTTARHRTLRAAITWSHDLCTQAEQRLWAELSVFPGTFSLEAVEHVCGAGTLATLVRLVDKSVVHFSPEGAAPQGPAAAAGRYYLLDTMREFGAELLADDGPVRARHLGYYLGLAQEAAVGSMTAAQPGWLARLSAETHNLRAALDYAFATPGQHQAGLELTTRLRHYWLMTGKFTEGKRWHTAAIEVSPGSAANGWALFGAGMLAVQQGELGAGAELLQRAGSLAADLGHEDLAAHVADGRAICAFMSGDNATARTGFEAALAAFERIGFSDPPALIAYSRLAAVCVIELDPARATVLTEECLRRCLSLGEQWAQSTALWVRGMIRWMTGDVPGAISDALACLRIKEPLGDLHTIAMSFDLLSVCLVSAREYDRAAVLNGAAETLWQLLQAPALLGPVYVETRASAADTACRELGQERFWALHRQGAALPLSAALDVAKAALPA